MTINLLNRDPEPDEIGVPVDQDVAVDIADDSGTGIATALTQVYIDGTLAYDGGAGGFQTGFTGAVSNPDTNTLRVVVDPDTDFDSEEIIDVRVVSDIVGTGTPIDTVYTFTVEDVTAPQVSSARALDKSVVQVIFNEDMFQDAGTLAKDALTASNYVFARTTAPAANVVASSVVGDIFNEFAFNVTLDIEMTPRATYLVTVSGAEDTSGNALETPTNLATFTGFEPPVPDGRRFNLYDMVPQMNRTEDVTGHLKDFLDSIQEMLNLLLCGVDQFSHIFDPDLAPEDWLDAILADLGNPFTFPLVEIDKRRLIRVLVDIYRQKGTCKGIVNAVRFFLGLEVDCDEYNDETLWILGESELGEDTILGPSLQFQLYSFNLVSNVILTSTQRDRIREIGNYMKPAHTHLVDIVEPFPAALIDHWELGISELGETTKLHGP